MHLAVVSGCLCPGPGLSVGVVRGLFAARPRYLLGVFATGSGGGEVHSASHAPSHNHAWLLAIPHARFLTEHTQLVCGGCACRVRVLLVKLESRGHVVGQGRVPPPSKEFSATGFLSQTTWLGVPDSTV